MPEENHSLWWFIVSTIGGTILTLVTTDAYQRIKGKKPLLSWLFNWRLSPSSSVAISSKKNINISYVTDIVFGVECEWELVPTLRGFEVEDLRFYCPECKTELVCISKQIDYEAEFRRRPRYEVHKKFPDTSKLLCEHCHTTVFKYNGFQEDMIRRIRDEIKRRIRTGEWKEAS